MLGCVAGFFKLEKGLKMLAKAPLNLLHFLQALKQDRYQGARQGTTPKKLHGINRQVYSIDNFPRRSLVIIKTK